MLIILKAIGFKMLEIRQFGGREGEGGKGRRISPSSHVITSGIISQKGELPILGGYLYSINSDLPAGLMF